MTRAEALQVNSHLRDGIIAKESREKKQQKPTWNICYAAPQNVKETIQDLHLKHLKFAFLGIQISQFLIVASFEIIKA